ncbi:MAG: DUF937 domain-containing protein [Paracoccaceae bacterium]
MNIVSMGMKYLGPVVATKIASMLGIKSPLVTKIIMAALPAVLAGLTGKASSGSGAGSLFSLLSNQKATSADDFASSLSGPDAGNISSGGVDMLTGLLGGSQVDALSGALGRYAGVPEAGSKSLLGMLAPAIMGSLKTQVQDNNLDADGLAGFLSSQKGNIASAMPAGFAKELSGTGLLDSVQANFTQPAAAAVRQVEQVAEAKSGGMMKWLLPLIIVAGLAWYFLGNKSPDVAEMAGDASIMVGDVDLGGQFGTVVDGLTTSLGSITDTASATAALPNLEQFGTELGSIGDLAGQLPDAGKSAFSGIVGTALATLKPLIETALGISGEGSALKPILDGLLDKLTQMAG